MSGPAQDSQRLEALSDGVFGFAATLLVVSLEVPRTVPELIRDLSGFGGFAISFAALMLLWTVHRAFFRRYHLADGWTIALNSFLLLVVLFYVYPLKFLASGLTVQLMGLEGGVGVSGWDELGDVFALYGAGFVGIFLAYALLYRHAHGVRETLGLGPFQASEALYLYRHYLIFVVAGVFSIAAALTGFGLRVGLPGWIYAFLGPACYVHGRWSERRWPELVQPPPGQG